MGATEAQLRREIEVRRDRIGDTLEVKWTVRGKNPEHVPAALEKALDNTVTGREVRQNGAVKGKRNHQDDWRAVARGELTNP